MVIFSTSKFKQLVRLSQGLSQLGEETLNQNSPQKIKHHDSNPVGIPIGESKPEQDQNLNNLPVFDPKDIGQFLEDEFDEPEQGDNYEQENQEDTETPSQTQNDEVGTDTDTDTDSDTGTQEGELPTEVSEPAEKRYPRFSNIFQASDWARQNDEVMRISYTTLHGRKIVRDVEVNGAFHSDSTKRQVMVTFDRTVGNIRAYVMTNIGSWAFTGEQFEKKFVVRG